VRPGDSAGDQRDIGVDRRAQLDGHCLVRDAAQLSDGLGGEDAAARGVLDYAADDGPVEEDCVG